MNWALKQVFFPSKFKSSEELRLNKGIVSVRNTLKHKSLCYFFQYIKHKKPFKHDLFLPTANYRLNLRSNIIVLQGKNSSVFFS